MPQAALSELSLVSLLPVPGSEASAVIASGIPFYI